MGVLPPPKKTTTTHIHSSHQALYLLDAKLACPPRTYPCTLRYPTCEWPTPSSPGDMQHLALQIGRLLTLVCVQGYLPLLGLHGELFGLSGEPQAGRWKGQLRTGHCRGWALLKGEAPPGYLAGACLADASLSFSARPAELPVRPFGGLATFLSFRLSSCL